VGNRDADNERRQGATDQTGESKLRGDAPAGPEQKRRRNPDTELRVDDEEDTLYDDGLESEDDTPPMGTAGRKHDDALTDDNVR
jgi:hypothetical protein